MTPIADAADEELELRAAYFRNELAPIERELSRRRLATMTDDELHSRMMHPDYEYETTQGGRKCFDDTRPPYIASDDPNRTPWERNRHYGRNGWERFDYHEEAYWMRRKNQVAK